MNIIFYWEWFSGMILVYVKCIKGNVEERLVKIRFKIN